MENRLPHSNQIWKSKGSQIGNGASIGDKDKNLQAEVSPAITLPRTMTASEERGSRLGVVKTLSNFTNNVSSNYIPSLPGGIMNYLNPSKSKTEQTKSGATFSPWNLFDNVNQQYALQANKDDLD